MVRKFNDQPRNLGNISTVLRKRLGCQCEKLRGCISYCYQNKVVKVFRNCWAGDRRHSTSAVDAPAAKMDKLLVVDEEDVHTLSAYPKDVEFAAAPCPRITCISNRDSNASTWDLGVGSPCHEWCHCEGPFCSLCKPGFERTMWSAVRLFLACIS